MIDPSPLFPKSGTRSITACAHGFTLIEMLLAIALSSILMVTVLGMIGSIRRVPTNPQQQASNARQQLQNFIEQDLLQSRAIKLDEDVPALYTYRALIPVTLAPTHHPVIVRYRIKETGDGHWLVREQSHMDPNRLIDDNWALTIALSADVARLEWHLVDDKPTEDVEPSKNNTGRSNDRKQPHAQNEQPSVITQQSLRPFIEVALFRHEDDAEPSQTLTLRSGNLSTPVVAAELQASEVAP